MLEVDIYVLVSLLLSCFCLGLSIAGLVWSIIFRKYNKKLQELLMELKEYEENN